MESAGIFAQSKHAPDAVSVKLVLLATAPGAIENRYGVIAQATIIAMRATEVPPPGDGLATVTVTLPGLARSPAGMSANSTVAETKRVVRPPPFQLTKEAGVKPEPVSV